MVVFSGTVNSDFLKYIPADLDNKEKLIDYSASDYSTILQALISYIKATHPLDYNNFSESDFGMMIAEMFAAVGHIQSIKSDYLANENFLRTARNRESVKKLLELIGVRMKGPISAAANARITIEVPDGFSNASSVTLNPSDRVVTITSPEDGASLTYTIYKVNNDGNVNLDSNTTDITFTASANSGVIIINNAVLLEGSLVVETGTFQSPEAIKSVTLSQYPYVERSAQVFVDGINPTTAGIYSEEENIFFASGGTDKVFQVVTDNKFLPTVVFGDSTLGQSPAIGDTYTITYRIGGGSRGNIASEVLNAPVNVVLGNGTTTTTAEGVLENIGPATGGSEAESIQHAKRYAPLIFRRQDRLVTLQDYKAFANTFISNYGSTGKANAVVRRAFSSANIIDVFVLEKASDLQLRKATPEYKRQLLEAIQEKKMLTSEPVVVDGLIRTLDLIITLNLDKKFKKFEADIRNSARNRIVDYFNLDNTDFGEPFIPQDLIKYVLDLDQIRYATVDNVSNVIRVDFNEIIQLNNLTINISYI